MLSRRKVSEHVRDQGGGSGQEEKEGDQHITGLKGQNLKEVGGSRETQKTWNGYTGGGQEDPSHKRGGKKKGV